MIPAVTERKGTPRLSHLREYLQGQGRLREARAVLDQELGHTSDGSEQQKACKSLLEACSNRPSFQEPIWWIRGRIEARLGQIASVCGQPEASKEEFQCARRILQVVYALGRENNTLLLVRLAEIDSFTNLGPQDLLSIYENFLKSPTVQKDNYAHSSALTRASTAALTLLENDTCPQNRAVFWEWSTKAEAMLRKLGDIAYLSIFRPATGDIACSHFRDMGAILKWYEQFEIKYPSFRLWSPKIAAKRQLLLIYNSLKDEKGIRQTIAGMRDIVADQDNFWYENGFKTQEEISRLSSEEKNDKALLSGAFQLGDPETEWLSEWSREVPVGFDTGWKQLGVNVGSNSVMPSTTLETLLCSWIKQDFQAGILTKRDLEDILSLGLVQSPNVSAVAEALDNYRIQTGEEERDPEKNIKSTTGNQENNMMSAFENQIKNLKPTSVSLGLYGEQTSPTSDSQWEKAFYTLSDWLLQKSTGPEVNRHYLLYKIQEQRLSLTIHSATSYKTRGLEAQRLIDLLPKLSVAVQQHVSSNLSSWINTVAAAKNMMYVESHGHVLLDTSCPEFEEIIGLYSQCLAENRGSSRLIREVHFNMDMATLYFYAAAKLDPKAIDGFFNAVDRAVQAFEKIRDGWRALTGWDKVQKLLYALEDRKILQIAPVTVAITCQFPDSQRKMRDRIIWSMLQFAKSIGVGWLMESNAANAQRERREDRGESERLAEKPNGCRDNGEMSDDSRGNPDIQPSSCQSSDENLTSADGQANAEASADQARDQAGDQEGDQARDRFSTDQVQEELQEINRLGADAVFVDWYSSASGLAKSPQPLIATLTAGDEGPKCCLAKITWEQVDNIVDEFMYFETEDLQDSGATKLLDELNPLVEPLSWIKPGQTLVFSPCGNLHQIPLHALKIDGEIIIKRNPVVYCSSLSALVVAFHMRKHTDRHVLASTTPNATSDSADHDTDSSAKAKLSSLVSLFGDPPSQTGRDAVENVAARFCVKAHTETEFNASSFTTTIQDPSLRLLHYHGHANFNPTAPMDHCLLFTDRALTLRDVFDLPPPLRRGGGFHVTLLGCGSGLSKTVPTNDVLGLVPSLLHAGASSTVSTLWRFSDADAAKYSEIFYSYFGSSAAGNAGGEAPAAAVVDLAKANQKAVLEIMREKAGLYHWGAFVLNGYWMMTLP